MEEEEEEGKEGKDRVGSECGAPPTVRPFIAATPDRVGGAQ